MLNLRLVVWMFSVSVMVLGAGVVFGQNYPNKPIRIVTSEPGGGTDFTSRLIAQGLTASSGWQVVVDNRAGSLIAEIVSRAPPDGYTLLLHGSSIWLLPFLQDNVPYDPVKDFLPITSAAMQPNVLVVHPSIPVKSVKELIDLAKAKPGELNYASSAIGGSPYLAAELFKSMAGVNIVHVPYKGAGPALNALIGGQTQLMFASASSVTPHVKSGRLRALAVTSLDPSVLVPGLPSVAASGVPGYDSVGMYGVFAPAKTLRAIINRLNQEIVQFLNTAEAKERFLNAGVEVVGSSPEQFAATIKSEMAKWGKLIKDAGIRAD